MRWRLHISSGMGLRQSLRISRDGVSVHAARPQARHVQQSAQQLLHVGVSGSVVTDGTETEEDAHTAAIVLEISRDSGTVCT